MEAGAKGVVFADINESVKEVAEESKKYARHAEYQALAVTMDIADAESVKSLVATVTKEFGRIDYAVNSAGVSRAYLKYNAYLLSWHFLHIIMGHEERLTARPRDCTHRSI